MPKKILLADDSITIQKVVELTFSDGDYEVTAVNNGAKAVQKLAEMRPDIILSDIIMPEKNGYEVCEYVKSHPEYRNIPVVLLTGTFEPFDPDRAEKAGCDAVVTKPFESQSLIHKVEELIANAKSAAPAPAPEPEPAASPWEDEPAQPSSPFSTASGMFPVASPEPFTHGSDIFDAPPVAGATTEMPFDAPGESPFGAPPQAEEFSSETRAFTKMSFDEMPQMTPEPETPPPAPDPSPWDEQPAEQPEPAFGGETRAFPRMTFDELQQMTPPPAPPPPEPDIVPEPESESPFGAPPPADELSGETRAFPKMSFEEMQQMMSQPAPEPEPPPAPEPSPWDEQPAPMSFEEMPQPATETSAAEEPSPWDEQPAEQPVEPPAFGGETRAFPKLSFDEPEVPAWEPPSAPAWEPPAAEASEPEPVTSNIPEDMPFAAESSAPPEETYEAEAPQAQPEWEQPQPQYEQSEPQWAPQEAAEAEAEPVEPPVPPPALAPEPTIPIAARELSDEQVDRIARRVVELMSDTVVRNIAWEVIPDLAEMVVKERIRQLEAEA